MLDSLEKPVSAVGALHSKLILLVGGPQSDKSALLDALGTKRDLTPMRVDVSGGTRALVRLPAIVMRLLLNHFAHLSLMSLSRLSRLPVFSSSLQ